VHTYTINILQNLNDTYLISQSHLNTRYLLFTVPTLSSFQSEKEKAYCTYDTMYLTVFPDIGIQF